MKYSNEHHGKILIRHHEVRTDPGVECFFKALYIYGGLVQY